MIEQENLDTRVTVSSHGEIGMLTTSFNKIVGELKLQDIVTETFGKYVDHHIVEALIQTR